MRTKFLLSLALALPALAQTSVKDALVKHWKITADFTIAVAKMMPAESYNFRPVPEELSFGQLIVQVAGANVGACATASGMTRPAVTPAIAKVRADEKADVEKD